MPVDYNKGMRPNLYEIMQGGGGGYVLPPATAERLGGVIVGEGVDVAADGTISVDVPEPYELPAATDSTLGGVKIGTNIDIDANGVISADTYSEDRLDAIFADHLTMIEGLQDQCAALDTLTGELVDDLNAETAARSSADDALEAAFQTLDNGLQSLQNMVDNEQTINTGTERVIGTFNGATLYRKMVDCGALLNADGKTVPHGISNLGIVTHVSGVANGPNNTLPLPLATTNAANNIYLAVGRSNITITTGSDRSVYNALVTVEYTKST